MEGGSEIVAGIRSFRGEKALATLQGNDVTKKMVLHKQECGERPVKSANPYPWRAVMQSTVQCVRAGAPFRLHSFSLWPRHLLESSLNSLAKMHDTRFCYYKLMIFLNISLA